MTAGYPAERGYFEPARLRELDEQVPDADPTAPDGGSP